MLKSSMIKRYVKSNIHFLLKGLGYEIRKYPGWDFPALPIFDLLVNYLLELPKVNFIQIGGNDGIYVDPIHRFYSKNSKWGGYIFEPNPVSFSRLEINLKDCKERIFAVNKGISNKNGIMKMFTSYDENSRQDLAVSSFQKKIFLKQKTHKSRTKEILVETITISEFLEKLGWNDFDLLQVDTEGHEYEIFETLDLTRFRPKIMQIETGHLSPKKISALTKKIASANFYIYWGGHQADMVCVQKNLIL